MRPSEKRGGRVLDRFGHGIGCGLVAAFIGLAEQLGVVYLSLHCFRSINAGGRIFEFGGVVFTFDHLRFMLRRMVEIPLHIVRLVSRAATGGKQEQGGGGKQMFFMVDSLSGGH